MGCFPSSDYPKLEMVSKGIFDISIDDKTSNNWFFAQIVNIDEEEYFVFQDHIQSDPRYIHFENLKENEKSFKIKLSLEGPEGIGHLDGFHVRNLDSIFVLNRYKYELNLVDTSGKVIDRFRLRNDDSNEQSEQLTALPFIWTFAPILDLGEKLVIPAIPDQESFDSQYKQKLQTIELKIKSETSAYKLGFSDRYFDSGFWGIHLETPSYTVNYTDSVILQSFPIEDRVMVFDFDLNLLKAPSLFSKYYDDSFRSLSDFNSEPSILYPHIYSNPKNNSILYDQYRELYYRVFSGPYPLSTIENWEKSGIFGEMGNNEYPDRKIMVFDRYFRELGVIELDKSLYWVDFIRVIKGGILVQRQTDDENKCTFELFEIKF